ncbi:hypothetical protein ACO03V_04395 [Microbacterium sp. HMH0099]|uniref:hypothetical protein n=1 Tax=Microbacterium sp. HMH0099 TaxID=3414026 RepID=UPI003BF69B92
MTPRRLLAPAAALLVASAVLAGCSSSATPETAPSIAPSDIPSSPAPEVTPSASAPVGDPTCDTIIPAATAEDFTSLGWSAQMEPFRIGSLELADGIQCKWGDQTIATDRVQVFGWAPIDETDSASAQRELVASGWRSETTSNGIYVTENPDWAIFTDADGYGITYLFGDGWVKLADTRQSLVLVEWPPVA